MSVIADATVALILARLIGECEGIGRATVRNSDSGTPLQAVGQQVLAAAAQALADLRRLHPGA